MKSLTRSQLGGACLAVAVAAAGLLPYGPAGSTVQELTPGDEIARLINERPDGATVSRVIEMELIDRNGKSKVRNARSFRKYVGDERRLVMFYQEPRNIRGTAFLTYDYAEADRTDDQWLYLPAMRKVRRISGSERGDYFMGTDFSYDDMKQETKVSLDDYTRTTLAKEDYNGREVYVVEATPVSDEVAEELRYSKVVSWVDTEIWITLKSEFWDVQGNPLKTVVFDDIRQVDGIWTVHLMTVENHKTGHKTVFRISDVGYDTEVSDKLFSREAMRRGV